MKTTEPIKNIILAIEKHQKMYNSSMCDMAGEWFYESRFEIEDELGMTIEEFERLGILRESLEILLKNNIKEFNSFSAIETAIILQLSL